MTSFWQGIPDVLEYHDKLLGSDVTVTGFYHDLPQDLRELRVSKIWMVDVASEDGPEPGHGCAGKSP